MKLYLSSYRIPDLKSLQELLGKKSASVAVIPNAKDYLAERARSVKLRDITDYLKEQGFNPELRDLRDYDDKDKLNNALQKYDMLWVCGGNTFCLRYEMQRSGYDQIASDLAKSGQVYAGESAGACAAGKTLEGLETADNPEFTEEVIWTGLNLVPYVVVPHVDNVCFQKDTKYALQKHEGERFLLKLNDDQAAVIDGEELEIVTGQHQE